MHSRSFRIYACTTVSGNFENCTAGRINYLLCSEANCQYFGPCLRFGSSLELHNLNKWVFPFFLTECFLIKKWRFRMLYEDILINNFHAGNFEALRSWFPTFLIYSYFCFLLDSWRFKWSGGFYTRSISPWTSTLIQLWKNLGGRRRWMRVWKGHQDCTLRIWLLWAQLHAVSCTKSSELVGRSCSEPTCGIPGQEKVTIYSWTECKFEALLNRWTFVFFLLLLFSSIQAP